MQEKKPKKIRGVYEDPIGSGIWHAQYFIKGQRHRERAGAKSHAIALYRKRKTEALISQKLPELNRRHVPFGELLDDAVRFSKKHHKSSHDCELKAELVRSALGSRWADSLTYDDLEEFIDDRGVSNATFNRYRAFFSLCFREGIRAGKVTTNPAKLMHPRRESAGRKRFLSQEEYSLVCAHIRRQAEHYRKIGYKAVSERWRQRLVKFFTSIWTGMRRSEQWSLEIPQLSWSRNEIQLSETKNGDSREIPMTPEVRSVLRAHIGARRTGKVFLPERDGEDPANMKMEWFDELLAELKISDYTWHNNRHTFCSWHAIAGTPLLTIKELAGHRSIVTTAQYAHLSPNAKRGAMEALAESHRKIARIPKPSKKAGA